MSRFIILCHCLAWVLTLPANTIYGARAPVAVKRRFLLRGDAAVTLGALFDLSVENHSSCLLRLGKFESQAALYLDEHAEAPPDDGDNVRELYNLMEFATESGPLLSISPYWLDTSTQEPACPCSACVAAVAERPTSLLAGHAFQSGPQQPKIPNEREIKANHALFSGHQRKLTEIKIWQKFGIVVNPTQWRLQNLEDQFMTLATECT